MKVGICVDVLGCGDLTPEDEIKQHKKWVRQQFPKTKLSFYRAWNTGAGLQHGIKPGTDLFLFDYGGMLMMGSGDTARSNARSLISWCEDNPQFLVLVTTESCMKNLIHAELRNQGISGLHNLISAADGIPAWFLNAHGVTPTC